MLYNNGPLVFLLFGSFEILLGPHAGTAGGNGRATRQLEAVQLQQQKNKEMEQLKSALLKSYLTYKSVLLLPKSQPTLAEGDGWERQMLLMKFDNNRKKKLGKLSNCAHP